VARANASMLGVSSTTMTRAFSGGILPNILIESHSIYEKSTQCS
jgi:hypothetical protein